MKYRKFEFTLINNKTYEFNVPTDLTEKLVVPVIICKRTVKEHEVYFVMEVSVSPAQSGDVIRDLVGVHLRFGEVRCESCSNVILPTSQWSEDLEDQLIAEHEDVFGLFNRYEYGKFVGEKVFINKQSFSKEKGMQYVNAQVNELVNKALEKFKERNPK